MHTGYSEVEVDIPAQVPNIHGESVVAGGIHKKVVVQNKRLSPHIWRPIRIHRYEK